MLRITRRLALVAGVIFLAACGGGDGGGPTESGLGSIVGRIVAADGSTPIPGAVVQLSSRPANGPVDTTDANGDYQLSNVPSGQQELVATRGLFEVEFMVTVRANESTTAAAAELQPTGKLAYVPGLYDQIEAIVRDSLEYPMTELDGSQLGTASVLSQYRMIFVNCGADYAAILDDEAALGRLRTWVSNGGVLYASDLALDLVQAMYPEHILSMIYGDPQDVTATVTSDALQRFIGKSTVSLRYDLPGWATPDELSATPQVLLRGSFVEFETTYTNKPLAVAIPQGTGKVIFTSFHNEAGVTADQLAVLRYFVFVE